MYSTAKKLRFNTKELLESIARGEEIIITFRGKPYAKLVPLKKDKRTKEETNELFGIWKDHHGTEDVSAYVRKLRKKRAL